MSYGVEEVGQVSDAELVSRLERLVRADRLLGTKLLVHLGELEERRLYLGRGYSSMYEYVERLCGCPMVSVLADSSGEVCTPVSARFGTPRSWCGAFERDQTVGQAPHSRQSRGAPRSRARLEQASNRGPGRRARAKGRRASSHPEVAHSRRYERSFVALCD